MGLVDRALWENRRGDPEAIESAQLGSKGRAWLRCWLPTRADDNSVFLVSGNRTAISRSG